MTAIKQDCKKYVYLETNANTSDKELCDAKRILGRLAENFTDEEIKVIVTEIHFLVELWLDDFERQVFNGNTLKELIYEKGRS